jgi:NifB/MoaA-like Fe-S oxidoreductase
MLENLIQSIKNLATGTVKQTPQIAVEHQESAIDETVKAIVDTFKGLIAKGKQEQVVKILMGKEPIPDNSILGEVINKLKGELATKLKMPAVEAELAAGKIAEGVMGTLVTKTENGGEQLRDIMQSLGGDLMGDIEGKFGKYLKDDDKPLKGLFD